MNRKKSFSCFDSLQIFLVFKNQFLIYKSWERNLSIVFWLFHDGCTCYIETSPLICTANQWTGFYMIETSVNEELMTIFPLSASHGKDDELLKTFNINYWPRCLKAKCILRTYQVSMIYFFAKIVPSKMFETIL